MWPRPGKLRQALDHEYAAAIAVAIGAVAALSWSALSSSTYSDVMDTSWWAPHDVGLRNVVVNGVMTLFFAAVGLELAHEFRTRLRANLRASFPPLFGAVGGMAGAAAVSVLLGQLLHTSALRTGWGVPMATDIAFTLGVLALAGSKIPTALRIFLLTLAIADDVLSVIVLSLSGVTTVRVIGLVAILLVIALGRVLTRRLETRFAFTLLLIVSWLAFASAGVEPALSGVVAGVLVLPSKRTSVSWEKTVTRCSTVVALPLFAFVACGVSWGTLHLAGAGGKIVLGTTVARIAGKTLGICAGVFIASRLGVRRDAAITGPILLGASLLCAIGFTVPLLFAGAIFGTTSATYGAFTVGLLGASVLGAVMGVALLRRATR